MTYRDQRRVEPVVPPLTWLNSIVWPDGQAELVPGSGKASVSGAGYGEVKVGLEWWASPNPQAAEILVPATSAAAARTAVHRYHNGFTLSRRARSWAAESVMNLPGVASLLLGRHRVTVTGHPTDGLLAELAGIMAVRHPHLKQMHVAMSLARPKSNRKPVLQLIDQNGQCLGWAKIGWNGWTQNLLGNESSWLQVRTLPPLITPRLLAGITIGANRVVVTSGVEASRWPGRNRNLDPELVVAIADLGTRDRLPLVDSMWWKSVEAVRSMATPSESRAIDQVAASANGLLFDLGAWHGDLTPWNIMSIRPSGRIGKTGGAVHQVIDWEFAADGVPVGFDLCHYHTQVASELKGMSTQNALDYSARLSPQGLASMGIDPHNQIAIYRLYLVELIRRTLALRAAGMPVDRVGQGAAAARRIRADLLPTPSDLPAGTGA